MDFLALDVETANASLASICQIGIAIFRNGELTESWSTLVNPGDYFDEMNISIHGITDNDVKKSPLWNDIYQYIQPLLTGKIVVSHTAFDRGAIGQACRKYELPIVACTWLDTARIVRRAWPDLAHSGYGLKNVAKHLSIKFNHHDAREDAQTAGRILNHAIHATGMTVADWLVRVAKPLDLTIPTIRREGDLDGILHGELVVFTGALTISRREAADLAARLGCDVGIGVTKHTTILICGDQDIRALNGHEKSSKHLKAELLIEKGQNIRILSENDFISLARAYDLQQ
ncbi:transposase [Glaciimonas sp. PCH181]|nr:transposase [Glaciimonas sp. PCH181]